MPADPKTVHIDKILTEISIRYTNGEYFSEKLAPVIPVKKESDKYFIYGRQHFRVVNAQRAAGSAAARVDFGLETDTYTAEEYTLASSIPDRIRDNADDPLDMEVDSTETLTDMILLGWDKRMVTAMTAAATWTGAAYTANVSPNWDAASATIQSDIDNAKEQIRLKCGRRPNTVLIPGKVAQAMMRDTTIRDLIKYTHNDLLVNGILPPKVFGLNVVITDVVEDTANAGQNVSLSDMMGENVFFAYVAPRPGIKTFSTFYTFRARPMRVRKWRDEESEATIIEVGHIQTEKLVSSLGGFLITDTLT